MFRILFVLFGHVQRLQHFIQTTRVAGQPERLPADQGDSSLMYYTRETRVGQIFELQTIRKLKAPYGSQIFYALAGCFQMIKLFHIKTYDLLDHATGEECKI